VLPLVVSAKIVPLVKVSPSTPLKTSADKVLEVRPKFLFATVDAATSLSIMVPVVGFWMISIDKSPVPPVELPVITIISSMINFLISLFLSRN
jgi:hypothetical protein